MERHVTVLGLLLIGILISPVSGQDLDREGLSIDEGVTLFNQAADFYERDQFKAAADLLRTLAKSRPDSQLYRIVSASSCRAQNIKTKQSELARTHSD